MTDPSASNDLLPLNHKSGYQIAYLFSARIILCMLIIKLGLNNSFCLIQM